MTGPLLTAQLNPLMAPLILLTQSLGYLHILLNLGYLLLSQVQPSRPPLPRL